jgi:DNA-binding CsgD family transcriptional regulator
VASAAWSRRPPEAAIDALGRDAWTEYERRLADETARILEGSPNLSVGALAALARASLREVALAERAVAQARSAQARKAGNAGGRSREAASEDVRTRNRHIRAWRKAGRSLAWIADKTGLSPEGVRNIVGPKKKSST